MGTRLTGDAELTAMFGLLRPVRVQTLVAKGLFSTKARWPKRIVDAIVTGDAEAAAAAIIEVIHNGVCRHEGPAAMAAAVAHARLRDEP
jgi:hypothetical protein